MRRFTLLLALLLVSPSILAEVRIAVLGVSNDMNLMERWAAAEGAAVKDSADAQSFRVDELDTLVLAPKPGASPTLIASTLYQADVALIVLNTTEGPLPVNRDHIIISRQADVPTVAIMMANVDQLYSLAPTDAREYLDIEEAEIREVLALYEVGGRHSLLFHDSKRNDNAPQSSAGGLRDAGTVLSKLGAARPQPPRLDLHQSAQGQVYFLTKAEANGHAVTISESAFMHMWSEGLSAPVEINAENAIGPGDVANVNIRTSDTFAGRDGSRILLMKNGHVVGLGVLTALSSP